MANQSAYYLNYFIKNNHRWSSLHSSGITNLINFLTNFPAFTTNDSRKTSSSPSAIKKKTNKQTNRPSENITAKVYKTQQVSLFRLPLFAPGRFCDHFCWTSLTQTGRWKIEIWFSWEVKVMSHVRIFSLRQVFQRANDSHWSEPYSRAQIQGWYGCICAMKMASKNKHKTTNQNTK